MQRVKSLQFGKNLVLAMVATFAFAGAVNAIACDHEGCSGDHKSAECKDCAKGHKKAEECKCKDCKNGTCTHSDHQSAEHQAKHQKKAEEKK